jgi:Glycoside-hydrolase family GH114
MHPRWSTWFVSFVLVLGPSIAGCGGGATGSGGVPGATGSDNDAASSSPGDTDGSTTSDPTEDAATVGGPDGGISPVAGNVWRPSSAGPIHFHWELSGSFRVPNDVIAGQGPIVYDIDGERNTAATVTALHALGSNVKVVCYVDVGTFEVGRSDSSQFPASVLGNQVTGYPSEKWLDIRDQSTLLPIMKARLATWCNDKGFDAVEPDNLDGWTNSPGFPLTEAENVSYDLAIASAAHALGLSVGVKNLMADLSTPNIGAVQNAFDWALTEQCFEYGQCPSYEQAFAATGKATWDVEYTQTPSCPAASTAHLNAQLRDMDLVAPSGSGYMYDPCIAETQTTW